MKKKIFLALFFLSGLINANEAVRIYKPKEIKFGEKFSLKFEIENQAGDNIVLSTAPLSESDFGFLGVKKHGNGFELFLIPFNVGISTFPPLEMEIRGTNARIKSYPLNLEIKPLYNPSEKDEIKDIARIFPFLLWLKILIILILLLLAYLLYRTLAGKKKIAIREDVPEMDFRTPYDKAMEKIKILLSSDYLDRESFKEYYCGLSDIFREYLEEEYSINAEKMTTNDIIREMKKTIDIKSAIKTREFLETADMVKFAKYLPGRERAEKDAGTLRELLGDLENFSREKKRKEEEKNNQEMGK
mgnify:CR=1 FL=1